MTTSMVGNGALVTFAVALITIANPIGNLAIFASLTADRDEAEKRTIATQSALAIALILVLVTWTGSFLLDMFGISVPAFQTAGGLIILLLGLSMLHSQPSTMQRPTRAEDIEQKDSIAIVPLAIPIVAGPGAMTTIIVETHEAGTIVDRIIVTAVCLFVAVLMLLAFRFATPIGRRLGTSGINVVTRIMGMVLAAIAIGMMAAGLKQLFPGLA